MCCELDNTELGFEDVDSDFDLRGGGDFEEPVSGLDSDGFDNSITGVGCWVCRGFDDSISGWWFWGWGDVLGVVGTQLDLSWCRPGLGLGAGLVSGLVPFGSKHASL